MSASETQIVAFDRSGLRGFSQMLADMMSHLLERLLPQSYQQTGEFFIDEETFEHLAPWVDHLSLWKVEPSCELLPWRLSKHFNRFHKPWPKSARDWMRMAVHGLMGRVLNSEDGEKRHKRNRDHMRLLQDWKPRSESESVHWSLLMGDALKVHLEGDTPGLPPQPLWICLSEQAWCDGDFQWAALKTLRGFFLERVLLSPSQRIFPPIHNQTYWALLALICPDSGGKPWGKASEKRLMILNQIAARMALSQCHWADFWDRWLLRRAMALRPKDAAWPNDTFQSAMEAIPLDLNSKAIDLRGEEMVESTGESEEADEDRTQPPPLPLAKSDHAWTPDWLEELKDLSF